MKNSLIISNGISHFNKQLQSFSVFFSQRTSLKNLPDPWPTLCSTLVYRNVFLLVHILIWEIRKVLKNSWLGEAPTQESVSKISEEDLWMALHSYQNNAEAMKGIWACGVFAVKDRTGGIFVLCLRLSQCSNWHCSSKLLNFAKNWLNQCFLDMQICSHLNCPTVGFSN